MYNNHFAVQQKLTYCKSLYFNKINLKKNKVTLLYNHNTRITCKEFNIDRILSYNIWSALIIYCYVTNDPKI